MLGSPAGRAARGAETRGSVARLAPGGQRGAPEPREVGGSGEDDHRAAAGQVDGEAWQAHAERVRINAHLVQPNHGVAAMLRAEERGPRLERVPFGALVVAPAAVRERRVWSRRARKVGQR